MNCSTCGESLVTGARFCPQCGAAVAAARTPSVDPLRALLEAALGTHYEIRRELGRGGMGTVFLAYEKGLDRDVAIKVLPPDRAESEVNRQRFRLEARAAARLSHANIVPLHTFGEHDGTLYYVMGYVDGESLADRLNRVGHLGEAEARRILAAVADALHYAHSRGVLHRDVKPQNILIESGSDRPLLTDFGISKLSTDRPTQTSTGIILGTPEYMSPEQASGNPDIDGRSDLYSLGLVGYALLSGRLPFQGRTPGELITSRLIADAPRLVCREPNVNPDLIETVMKCLARDPRRRWPDGAELSSALTRDEEAEPEFMEGAGLLAIGLVYAAIVAWLTWWFTAAPSVTVELVGKITPVLAALIVLTVTVGAIDLRRRGRTMDQVWPVIFREPASWNMWYPERLRRRGNVWHRLPREARSLRMFMTVMSVALVLATGPMIFTRIAMSESWVRHAVLNVTVSSLAVTLVTSSFFAWLVAARLRRLGLSQSEAGAVAYRMPTSKRGFWSRPAVAAVLSPATSNNVPGPAAAETRTVDAAGTRTRVD